MYSIVAMLSYFKISAYHQTCAIISASSIHTHVLVLRNISSIEVKSFPCPKNGVDTGCRIIAPPILYISTRWRQVPSPLYGRQISPLPRAGHVLEKRKITFPYTDANLDRPASSPVAKRNRLLRLQVCHFHSILKNSTCSYKHGKLLYTRRLKAVLLLCFGL
jgi:hypothetical protein